MLGDVGDRDGHALRRLRAARADQERVRLAAEARGERERLQRDVGGDAVGVLDEDEVHDATPICSQEVDDGGRRLGPAAEHLGLLRLALRHDEPRALEPRAPAASGVVASSGLRPARIRPGTDG